VAGDAEPAWRSTARRHRGRSIPRLHCHVRRAVAAHTHAQQTHGQGTGRCVPRKLQTRVRRRLDWARRARNDRDSSRAGPQRWSSSACALLLPAKGTLSGRPPGHRLGRHGLRLSGPGTVPYRCRAGPAALRAAERRRGPPFARGGVALRGGRDQAHGCVSDQGGTSIVRTWPAQPSRSKVADAAKPCRSYQRHNGGAPAQQSTRRIRAPRTAATSAATRTRPAPMP